MDIKEYAKYYKRTEGEIIHWDIFKDTSNAKYQNLGVAQGLYFIYDLINEYKDQVKDNEVWLKTIKNAVMREKEIGEYFERLLNNKTD